MLIPSRPILTSLARLGGLCCAGLFLLGSATAQATDTLKKIRDTQEITIGSEAEAPPFSDVSPDKKLIGYSIDLCRRVVDQLRKDLNLPALKANYQVVTFENRFDKLLDGSIDLECGSTTITQARKTKVDFSFTFFVAGMKVLTNTPSIAKRSDLEGKKVAVVAGTTAEKLFGQLKSSELKGLQIVSFSGGPDALKALQTGKVAAYADDDILMQGLLSTAKNTEKLRFLEEYLSVEPYGIMVRKGDKALLAVVDKTLVKLYQSGEIQQIYARWFLTEGMNAPMMRLTRESIIRPTKESASALLLGYEM